MNNWRVKKEKLNLNIIEHQYFILNAMNMNALIYFKRSGTLWNAKGRLRTLGDAWGR